MQTCWSSSCAPFQQPPVASPVGYCRRRRVVLQTVQKMPLNGADVVHETRRCTKQGVLLSVSSDPRRETVCVDLLVVILCVPSTIAGRLSRALLMASARCPANTIINSYINKPQNKPDHSLLSPASDALTEPVPNDASAPTRPRSRSRLERSTYISLRLSLYPSAK